MPHAKIRKAFQLRSCLYSHLAQRDILSCKPIVSAPYDFLIMTCATRNANVNAIIIYRDRKDAIHNLKTNLQFKFVDSN